MLNNFSVKKLFHRTSSHWRRNSTGFGWVWVLWCEKRNGRMDSYWSCTWRLDYHTKWYLPQIYSGHKSQWIEIHFIIFCKFHIWLQTIFLLFFRIISKQKDTSWENQFGCHTTDQQMKWTVAKSTLKNWKMDFNNLLSN